MTQQLRSPAVRHADPLQHLRDAAAERERAGLTRTLTVRPAQTPVLDLASNDYLGLARDERVTSAAAAAALRWGGGSTGSRLVTGTTELHRDLEQALADHSGSAAALVHSSGYLANISVLTALSDRDTLIVSDASNHASIIDSCRLTRARVAVTPHLESAAVADALEGRTESRAIVVTDAVFSVDGEAAPLRELAMACREYGALLVVDEAHSFGVVGESGRGAVWAAGLAGDPHVITTITLSKALASQGGAVLGDEVVIEHLINTARSFIFDTGLAPAAVGAAAAALDVIRAEPDRAQRARDIALRIAATAAEAGLAASRPDAAVLSIRIGHPERAVAAAAECLARGIYVGCFRPPSVPDADSRLRITARADLTEADLDRLVGALRAVAELVGDAGEECP